MCSISGGRVQGSHAEDPRFDRQRTGCVFTCNERTLCFMWRRFCHGSGTQERTLEWCHQMVDPFQSNDSGQSSGKIRRHFWFSFFHEAYHILYGEKKRLYIAEEKSSDKEEQKADAFAAQILIPQDWNKAISQFCTKNEVVSIAKQLSISPGIVAGRYRHLTGKWYFFKDLTRSYCWGELIDESSFHA